MSIVSFSGSGYGATPSIAAIESATALGAALRVKGSTLKAVAVTTTATTLFWIGSAAAYKFFLSGRRGLSGAGYLRLVLGSKAGNNSNTADDIPLAAVVDGDYYTIWMQRDATPLGGTGAIELVLYADDGSVLGSNVTASAAALNTGAGLGMAIASAKGDGTNGAGITVDGIAIYTRGIAVADRPIATAPSPSAPNLAHLWYFDEGSGTTATDEVASVPLTLTGATWGAGGTWPAAAPGTTYEQSTAGAVTPAGALTTFVQPAGGGSKSLAGSITPVGTLPSIAIGVDSLEGVLTPVGTLTTSTSTVARLKSVAGALAPSGALVLSPRLTLGGGITLTGTVTTHTGDRLLHTTGGSIALAGLLTARLRPAGIGSGRLTRTLRPSGTL